MALKTKQYSIHVRDCWHILRKKIGTIYELVEIVRDCTPNTFDLLCTMYGTPYDETPETQKMVFQCDKIIFTRWMVGHAIKLHGRKSKKLKRFVVDFRDNLMSVTCHE